MGLVTRQPTASEAPAAGVGGLGVSGLTNTGHSISVAAANAFAPGGFGSDTESQTRSARWFSFSGVGDAVQSIRLKFNWSIAGNASADDGGGGGSASSGATVDIEYSTNGGASWNTAVSDLAFAVAPGVGGGSFGSSGSADIGLSPSQVIGQVQVRSRMDASANANGGESIGANAQADASISINTIRLEITTLDGSVIVFF